MGDNITQGRRQFVKATVATGVGGITGITGCLGATEDEISSITGTPLTRGPDDIFGQAFREAGEMFEEETDGEVEVEIVTLETEEEAIDATADGSIDLYHTSMGALTVAFAPELDFLETPFVTRDYDHFLSLTEEWVHDGPLNESMIEEGNQRVLDSTFRGQRGTITQEPVSHVDDVQGMQMRVPQFDDWVQIWDAVGVNPTPVDAAEVYQALETGVVESMEAPVAQYVSQSTYEVATYFTQTDHLPQTFNYVINNDTWESMSDGQQELFTEILRDRAQWATDQVDENTEELFDMLIDEHDVTLISSDEVDRDSFVESAESRIEELFDEEWESTFDEVLDT
ncbi:TRAP transporter substrate-binding protein [Natronorarus salvus]|uniref:TRAP transporter substrate-binding protein n=1 Tax=Natronorarus salvus TaxID=3117733 RepID=UPI002F260F79